MDYTFKSVLTPFDFFRLSMHRTYHSVIGVCNIVFTVAVFLLTAHFWNQTSDFIEVLLFVGCILFPVLQPLAVYMKAKAQARMVPQDMVLKFDDVGLHVSTGGKSETIRWEKLKGVVREYKMIILFSDARHGYILTDRMLGGEKEMFYEQIRRRISQE